MRTPHPLPAAHLYGSAAGLDARQTVGDGWLWGADMEELVVPSCERLCALRFEADSQLRRAGRSAFCTGLRPEGVVSWWENCRSWSYLGHTV